MARPTLRATVGAFVAAAALLPVLWLCVRGADAGGVGGLFEVMIRDSWATLIRSLGLSFGVAALALAVSLPAAWLTEATDLPGRRVWRVLLTLPLAVPSYVSGFVVIAAFSPRGWLTDLGLSTPDVYGAFGATAALFFAYPYALLPIRASLARLDQNTWDAARSLGASPVAAFRHVVLPRLRPALASGGLLVGLYALSDFGAVSLTRFRTLSYVIYLRYQSLFGRDEAVLYAWWLVAVAALLVLAHRLVGGAATRGVAAHPTRAWQPLRLGRWRWPALAFCTAVTCAGVVLPVAVVVYWLVRGISNGAEIHPFGGVAIRTVLVGLAGATVVVLAALGPALLPAGNRFTRFVRGAVHAGYALPGIVVALALVYFATHGFPAIYQTLPLLLLAYVIRFVPVSGGTLSEHADAQDPHLVEAARSLGRTPREATRQVVLPLLAPALFAAFVAAFISVIKELPATLLVAPIEFDTLATHIWALTEEAFFTSVAAPILLLLILSALLIGVLQRSSP
ncbi:MAG: iron(III) transport system permease protein [Bradymonadia bacterium]|jgi:iron(III) transport system permease protein